jgi:hypothetical protein
LNARAHHDEDTTVLNAARSRQRPKNLKRDPRVAISVFDQSNPYSSASIRGKVVEITEKGAEEHIDRMNMKYHGMPRYAYHTPNDPRVLIRVEAKRIPEM